MYDLIILGGGPAGLTATIYALRRRLNTLLISKDLGGKTNFRLQLPDLNHHLVINGEEVINRFVNEIEYLYFARVMAQVQRVTATDRGYRVELADGATHEARALIVATGANPRRMNVPGEKEFWMRGLCYSAISYAPLFIERTTAVVGDNELALRAVAELAQVASRVTLIAPTHGALDSLLGKRILSLPNVLVLEGYRPTQVNGNAFAHSISITNGDDAREIRADGIFVELGLMPNTAAVKHLVECDAQGRIKIDARNRTNLPGLFAAGDVTNAFAEQVLISIGEGAKAALAAYEYLLALPMEEPALAGEWR